MRIERWFWLGAVIILLFVLSVVMRQKSNLEHSFLANDKMFDVIRRDAVRRYKKYEGSNDQLVNDMNFISFLSFRNHVCIAFVLKPWIYGGESTYCYRDLNGAELVEEDHTGA
jgi:hypothetical protein